MLFLLFVTHFYSPPETSVFFTWWGSVRYVTFQHTYMFIQMYLTFSAYYLWSTCSQKDGTSHVILIYFSHSVFKLAISFMRQNHLLSEQQISPENSEIYLVNVSFLSKVHLAQNFFLYQRICSKFPCLFSAALLLGTSSSLLYSRYHYHIKVWLYSRGVTWLKKEDERDHGKFYDAFVSSSDEDLHWVIELILPGMMQGFFNDNFEVCT